MTKRQPAAPKGSSGAKARAARGRAAATRGEGMLRWADDTPVNTDDARGRIIDATLACVERYGIDKTGMDDVAKAAAISRPTVYKYFASRDELVMASFLRLLDQRLERGLGNFLKDATTVDDLLDGVADAVVFVLGVLRTDEAIQSILFGSRLATEELLRGAAGMLVGMIELAITRVIRLDVPGALLDALRPFDLEQASKWVIRSIYSFLVWPGASPDEERAAFRNYLSPIFFGPDRAAEGG